MQRRAKIVATIGPASDSPDQLRKLIQAGLDVARLNFSHGTHEEHAAKIQLIRRLSEELHKPVSILQDLQGPKLRVGRLPEEGVFLHTGQKVLLISADSKAEGPLEITEDKIVIPLTVPNLAEAVSAGNRILMDDGNLELLVKEIVGEDVITEVVVGGKLTSHKGVNLPGAKLLFPGE